jgi:pSer/pThr/pTyr-binding forkhead associated (FHA) protein
VLRVVSSEDYGKEFPLEKDITAIGKAGADINLPADSYASHAHARLIRGDGGVSIEDLSSRNGTFIQARGKSPLQDGDRILIGTTMLEYRRSSASGTGPAAAGR